MSYTLTEKMEKGFIRFVLSGSVKDSDMEGVFRRMAAIHKSGPFQAVLVDPRKLESIVSVTSIFQSAQTAAALFPPGIRVAIIDRPEHAKFAEFSEDANANRGILLKHFEDEDEAIAWLTEDV